ncbi:MAG: (Fe-S)-binding protein [Chloroflexi bacterium]|jgi:Fe-S oxidoreductase|nr:(Fe-S)-binding protein [Chloroflexota bacterium]MBT3670556.1 (Fe-S)-binding protein [Chloroflexota bacterium]MBT4002382.1 (Fe-S)-binding protein [Chloroflexota bacterium]MBT4304191.1 (Fe-S)-binding protein [Chloroflexota bacterium]MBT4533450.1 (Fe-S)-binding protein [Chloroflexota bacterium]
MLSPIEKIIFILAAIATVYAAIIAIKRITAIIGRGQGQPDWSLVPKRIGDAIIKFVAFPTMWRTRFLASFFHALVAWGFSFYLLVNIGDVLQAFFPDFHFFGTGTLGNIYRLLADILTVGALVGMLFLMIRRFIAKDPSLKTRESTLLHPKAKAGKQRDSLIVGLFILLHVGFRFIGETFKVAMHPDSWQPFATFISSAWNGWSENALVVGEHVSFWIAIGGIMAFIPYFAISKHIHLFFAPLNFLLKPERLAPGVLDKLDFEDESIDQFGATNLEDLAWHSVMDAYACIMCNRCQDACPAYTTGKVLSPAALEINKRYFINQEAKALAAGEASSQSLLDFAITEEAVFACTACGACTDICPVGNDPMRDILDIRRALVLMDSKFPEQWQAAFRGMERSVNPWNIPPAERMKWAEGIPVPTIEENAEPDILWWVGCAPATDLRAQKTAQSFAKILNKAGVNYSVLGKNEQCTGDSARRAGNEYLYFELATANVEILNEVAPKKIVAPCPHCLHTLKNEYPDFGGNYEVIHHSQLINELLADGKIELEEAEEAITFHDPCYLGRQNDILIDPRQVLTSSGANLIEMEKSGKQSFCCGAGGAQMWKEEEHGEIAVSLDRYNQAKATGANTIAVGCPFCLTMMTDANKDEGEKMKVKDIAEVVAERMK